MCFSVRCARALLVLCFGVLIAAHSAETSPPLRSAPSHPELTAPAETRGVCEARAHPSYKVFAAQLRLPAMTALDGSTLDIGGRLKLDFRKTDRMAREEGMAFEKLLEIPHRVFTALVRKLSANPQSGGGELAHQFQTAVIDYKYLSKTWRQYHPGPAGESVKAEALNCLQAGDVEKAWKLFIDLRKPAPPAGLQARPLGP